MFIVDGIKIMLLIVIKQNLLKKIPFPNLFHFNHDTFLSYCKMYLYSTCRVN